MPLERAKLRWNGWGWVDAPDVLGDQADSIWAWVSRRMGLDPLPHTPPVELGAISLPPMRLSPPARAAFEAAMPRGALLDSDYERVFHARGKSYLDLLHLRAGDLGTCPDAVAYPAGAEECVALCRAAVEHGVALAPFGGGSSVVGGVNALTGSHHAVLSVDTTHMDAVLGIDETARAARVQAGIYGPALEEQLQARGFTLSHYPQSFEFSTLGGWIAARGAGHQSNRYGKAEHWLLGAQVATPDGPWEIESFPGSAAGPQLRDIIAGSEGTLGIITEAAIRIHPVPEVKDYRGYVFMDFAAAVEAHRELMQAGVATAMIRLSDEDETRFYTALKMGGEEPGAEVRFCAMLVGLEGARGEVAHALQASRAIIEGKGGVHMGESLGESWYSGRFETPYLRDPLLDRGIGVDTLETCTTWPNMLKLHGAVRQAIEQTMESQKPHPEAKGIVMAHISHAYETGASLYFTFVFPRAAGREVEQWWAIKRAASEAIIRNGGTISHHHGVGADHLEWIAQEKGPMGMAALRAVKHAIDPAGVLNPGKLLPL